MALTEGAWKGLGLLVKGVFGILVMALVTFFGTTVEHSWRQIAEANK